MKPQTTIVLILLAGDLPTSQVLDLLLREFQESINHWKKSDPPDVYCLYYRWIERLQRPDIQYYQIHCGTLQFLPPSYDLDPDHYPLPPDQAHTPAPGDLVSQITEFLRCVQSNLADEGPIRVVVGAHGFAGVGIKPTLLQRLWLLWRILLSLFDRDLRRRSWSERWFSLTGKIKSAVSPPGEISAGIRSRSPELRLDVVNNAFKELPCERLTTLILHTCQLSNLEAIVSLSQFPHHIACESELASFIHFQDWFSTFADPKALMQQITDGCVTSLKSTPSISVNANGIFSSHKTVELSDLLCNLNMLGARLNHSLSSAAAVRTITFAISRSFVNSYQVDLSAFCSRLRNSTIVPNSLLDAIIEGVHQQQLTGVPLNTTGLNRSYQGISVFLPGKNNSPLFRPIDLPPSFLTRVPDWHVFLNNWQ